MKFSFTDDQLELRDAVRDLLTKECTPQRVREASTNDTGRIPGLWQQLADMGVVGLLAPEANGGLGMDDVDLVLLLEETGRVALPEPIVDTAAVAVPLLVEIGDARLDAMVRGDITACVAGPPVGFATWADTATVFVYAPNGRLFEEPTLTPHASVDGSRRVFDVDVVMTMELRDTDEPRAAAVVDRGSLATAAQLCGLTDRMIEMTVEYAKERKQFGAAIGSFQAVKHHLANARLALEFARPLVYRAAYSVAHRDPACHLHVSMAKAQASDAAASAARIALQCHGAIGYTTEYDLHLYMKRTWALARAWGDPAWHRQRVEHAVLGTGGTNG
jgi:alkylation response protein AidB-like acyl-CoA dehydrogenase